VTVLERTNVRELRELPFAPELVVCDVSFVSVRKALPPRWRSPPGLGGGRARQAAVRGGRAEAPRGVVRDRESGGACCARSPRRAGWGAQVAAS
jgi:hypothetical protein